MDLGTALRWAAERYPDRRAVGGAGRRLGYRGVGRTHQPARPRAGAELGVTPGDRVALVARRRRTAGQPPPRARRSSERCRSRCPPGSDPTSSRYCIQDADATAARHGSDHGRAGGEARGLPVRPTSTSSTRPPSASRTAISPTCPAEDAISVMLYTSGTTGRPKGVPRTHRAEHSAAVAHAGPDPATHRRDRARRHADVPHDGPAHPAGQHRRRRHLGGPARVRRRGVRRADHLRERQLALPRPDDLLVAAAQTAASARPVRLRPARLRRRGDDPARWPSSSSRRWRPSAFVNHFGCTEIYTFTIGPDVAAKPGCAGRAGIFSRVRLVDPSPEPPADAAGRRRASRAR